MKKLKMFFAAMLFCITAAACLLFTSCEETLNDDIVVTVYMTETSYADTYGIDEGTILNLYEIPMRDHYTFLGLYDAQGGQIVNANGAGTVAITQDVTLYGRWLPNTYTIKFNPNGGEFIPGVSSSPFSMVYGSTFTSSFPAVEMVGYDFVGWFSGTQQVTGGTNFLSGAGTLDSMYTVQDGEIELVAQFKEKIIGVTFEYNDGVNAQEFLSLPYGTKLTEEQFPVIDTGSRKIVGWTQVPGSYIPFDGTLTQDVTLFPIWKNYKLIELYAFPDSDEPTEIITVFEGDYLTPELPENPGYEFDGWYTSTLFNKFPEEYIHYSIPADKLYAKWNLAYYVVEFVTNNGTTVAPVEYTILSDSIALAELTKENFTFVGWCKNEDLTDTPITEITTGMYGVTTLYAKFKGDDKTVVFDAGLGSLGASEMTVEYFSDFGLPIPIYNGYEFQGWYTSDGDDAVRLTDKTGASIGVWEFLEESTTVYAKYKQKFYVTVSPTVENAGNYTVNEYYVAGDVVTLNVTVNDGYKLIGWYENGVLCTKKTSYSFTMTESNRNLELRLEAQEFTLNLNTNGGICKNPTATVTYGQKFDLPVAFKEGHRFLGWKYNDAFITDAEGTGLNPWKTIADNVELTAEYAEEDTGAILITTVEDFVKIKDNPGGYYVLAADIDLNGTVWVPFAFSGTIIGNGSIIKNVSLESSEGNLGMFTKITGTVKDIKLENLSIVSTSYSSVLVGGLCAELSGGTLSGIEVRGSVTGDFGRIGGLVGKMTKGTIKNCKNYATVSSQTYESAVSAGGIAGLVDDGTVSGCKNYGAISIGYHCGGVIGACYTRYVSELENHGPVSGKSNVGGVIGYFDEAGTYTVTVFTNTGIVTGEENVGGVFGAYYDNATWGSNDDTYTVNISKIKNSGKVQGINNVGGCFGRFYANISGSYSDGSVIAQITALENTADITGTLHVGGLFGYAYADNGNSKITNSKSSGAITAEAYVGGLAGQLDGIRLTNSDNTGTTVNATYYYLESSTSYAFVGGYVGRGYYVENCHNAVSILYTEGGIYVGGIAGFLSYTANNCSNTAAITASDSSYVGGIAGMLSCTGSYDVVMLTNSGAISGAEYVAGVIGCLNNDATWGSNDSTYTLKINKITNTGEIRGTNKVAGCFGRIYASITGSYSDGSTIIIATLFENTANITGTYHVGGIVGYAYSDNGTSQIANSKSTGSVTADAYVGGLAGYLDGVKLINSSNKGASVSANGYYLEGTTYYAFVGGYVGRGYYIENCHNDVPISYTDRGLFVGGIAGQLTNTIKNSSNTASVNAPSASYVGGLVGEISRAGTYELTGLNNSGAVTGADYVAGVVGCITNHATWNSNDDTYKLTINKIVNSGDIKGNSQVAGCFGRIYANITGSYSDGTTIITSALLENSANVTGASYVGGLIGYAYSDNGSSQVTNSKSSGAISAEYYVGGLAGQLENIKLSDSSNEGSSVSASYYIIVNNETYHVFVGGYVGRGYYVENCHNDVPINYTDRGMFVGGIAGQLTNTIKNSSNTAKISAPLASYVGGLVGEISCAGTYELMGLNNSGAVDGTDFVAGIVGCITNHATWNSNDDTYNLKINKIVNSGEVSGRNQVAGCFGRIYVNITGSYSDGTTIITAILLENSASVTGTSYVGGLIGYAYSDNSSSQITNSKSTGAITAEYYVGGLAGQLENVKLIECSNEGASVFATGFLLVNGSTNYVFFGGYVGRGYCIENCHNATSITYAQNGWYVGGVAGFLDGYIKNSSNTADVSAPSSCNVGGLVGELASTGSYDLANLTNSGNVIGADCVGGIIGALTNHATWNSNDSTYNLKITKNENTGNVTGKNKVAGCFGKIYGNITGSYSDGVVILTGNDIKNSGTVVGESYCAAIAGEVYTDGTGSTLSNCSSTGTVNGTDPSTVDESALDAFLVAAKTNCTIKK